MKDERIQIDAKITILVKPPDSAKLCGHLDIVNSCDRCQELADVVLGSLPQSWQVKGENDNWWECFIDVVEPEFNNE